MMNRITVFSGLVLITAVTLSFADSTFDSIASYSIPGPSSVTILNIINTNDQLDRFLVKTSYDTTQTLNVPDFNQKTVIGLLTMTGGGNIVRYRKLLRVVDNIDTVILEVKPDSTLYEESMSIQASSNVLLLVIPKTGKPVILRQTAMTGVHQPCQQRPSKRPTFSITPSATTGRTYDIRGCLLRAKDAGSMNLRIIPGTSGAKTFIATDRAY